MLNYAPVLVALMFLVFEVISKWFSNKEGKEILYKVFGLSALRLDIVIILGVSLNAVFMAAGSLYNGIINIIVIGIYALIVFMQVELQKGKRLKLFIASLAVLGTAPTVFIIYIPSSVIMCSILVLILWLVGVILRVGVNKLIAPWQIALATFITVYDGYSILMRLGLV